MLTTYSGFSILQITYYQGRMMHRLAATLQCTFAFALIQAFDLSDSPCILWLPN